MKKYKVLKDFHGLKKGDVLEFVGFYFESEKDICIEAEKAISCYGINKIELREDYIQECGRDWFEEIYQDKK